MYFCTDQSFLSKFRDVYLVYYILFIKKKYWRAYFFSKGFTRTARPKFCICHYTRNTQSCWLTKTLCNSINENRNLVQKISTYTWALSGRFWSSNFILFCLFYKILPCLHQKKKYKCIIWRKKPHNIIVFLFLFFGKCTCGSCSVSNTVT